MAITQQDLQPFINQPNYPAYSPYVPSYAPQQGILPNFGGSFQQGGGANIPGIPNSGSITDILGSGDPLFGALFGGGGQQSFKPYVNAQGQYVFAPAGSRNPVPVANVPGAPLTPNRQYQKQAANTQAIQDLLPYLTNAANQASSQQIQSDAGAQLAAAQQTSGPYAQLMTQLYNQYGPQLNAIGNEIQQRNALAQAGTTNLLLGGPGQQIVSQSQQLQQQIDPEYYAARAQGAQGLSNLINSIDLSGGLSQTERNEIGQGLARQNAQRGTLNAPSQTDTVANAMQYGQAGYARTQQAKSNLSQALNNVAAFLPQAKSGNNAFQMVTGQANQTNTGNNLFTGLQGNTGTGNNAYGLAGNTLSGLTNLTQTQMQLDATKKDWLDQFNQLTSGIGNLTKGAGGIVGGL